MIVERRAVGDGRHFGINSKTDTETAQEVEMKHRTQSQRLALDDVVVVSGEQTHIVVDMRQKIVDIGNTAIVGAPNTINKIRRNRCFIIIGSSRLILSR